MKSTRLTPRTSRTSRTQRRTRSRVDGHSPAQRLLAAGLGAAALGLIIDIVSGVDGFPLLPPGPIMLAGAALVVALTRSRWAAMLGLAVALFITVGNVVSDSGNTERLGEPSEVGPFAGTSPLMPGLLLALFAGAAAATHAVRRS